MYNAHTWPQQGWKSCAIRSNIVALRFGEHRTKETLGVVGWKVWAVSDFMQQHPPKCNRVCKRTQNVTSNNVGSCWSKMLRPFARDFRIHFVSGALLMRGTTERFLLGCKKCLSRRKILGTPTWPPFYFLETLKWRTWRHVKKVYCRSFWNSKFQLKT